MTKPTKPLTQIAAINGNKLFRVEDGGQWEGDFWFELADGEQGFIDGEYQCDDETRLVVDFLNDYATS